MKHRGVSLACAVCLAVSAVLPSVPSLTAAAGEETYDLWIAGTQVTDSNNSDILGDGVFEFSAYGNCLKIHGDYTAADVFNGDIIRNKLSNLTIYVAEDSKLKAENEYANAINSIYSMDITGPGKLDISVKNIGIYVNTSESTKLSIHDTVLNVSADSYAITSNDHTELEVSNACVHAVCQDHGAIVDFSDVTLDQEFLPQSMTIANGAIKNSLGNNAAEVFLTPYLFVGNVWLKDSNLNDILNKGVFSYDINSKTLKIHGNYTYTSTSAPIINSRITNLTIETTANSELISQNLDCIWLIGSDEQTQTYFEGSGTLKLTASADNGIGIKCRNAYVNIYKGNLIVTGKCAIAGVKNSSGNFDSELYVNYGSALDATCLGNNLCAIQGFSDIRWGAELIAPDDPYVVDGALKNNSNNPQNVSHVQFDSSYSLEIARTRVKKSNCGDILGNGVFSYDPTTTTLSVHGDFSTDTKIISSGIDKLVIYVESDSVLTSVQGLPLDVERDTTITGPGQLTLNASSIRAVWVGESDWGAYGHKITLNIKDANLKIKSRWQGIDGPADNNQSRVNFINSNVTIDTTSNYAVSSMANGIGMENCIITRPSNATLSDTSIVYKDTTTPVEDLTIVALGKQYDLKICGQSVNDYNCTDVLGDGNFSYNPQSNVLTVRGTTEYSNRILQNKIAGLVIEIAEDAVFSTNNNFVINIEADTTIRGLGSNRKLKVLNSSESGIYVLNQATLQIENLDLQVSAENGRWGICGNNKSEKLIIKNSSVSVTSGESAFCDFANIILSGCLITSPQGASISNGAIIDSQNSIADAVTIEAVKLSTVTYKANGASGADQAQTHVAGSKINLYPANTFTRDGYTFTGWNTKADGSGNTYAAGKEVSWVDNVTLYAQWQKLSTITYKPNGASGGDTVQQHGSGAATTLYLSDTYSRDGYLFTGWNTKADGSGNTYEAGKTVSWYDNVTLYAQWAKASTITYKANGASGSDVVQTHIAGKAATLKPANTFTKSGYIFCGWNTKADGSGNTYEAGKSVSWYDNVTLYAIWKAERTITYKGNGATTADVVQKHGAGVKIKLYGSSYVRPGYVFVNWNTKADGSGNTYVGGQEVAWFDNVTLYAQWKPARTITYKANGASGSDVVQTHGAGVKVALKPANTFTRSGYVFCGWNSKADGSGNTYGAEAEVSWMENVTLYAIWKQSRTITYKANGASGSDVVQTHGAGVATTLKPANTFTRSGYIFMGWNSKADGSGNTYEAGKTVSWNDNVTLYAIWKAERTITYKGNGATTADVVQKHGAGVKIKLYGSSYVRPGYVFVNWNTKADGSGNTYVGGQEVAWFDNVTLYAQWKPARTITYKANGASGSDVVQTHAAGVATTLKAANTFTRSGYVFCGWNSKADGSGNTYEAGKSVSWNDNVTLYAIWKASRTITYKANGGTGADVVQTHGAGVATTLKAANTFSRSGYVFCGWNSKADGSGNTYEAGKSVSWNDNVTLYAVWKPARTITYKANGASGADVVQVHGAGVATTLKPANTFTRSGYSFVGWNSAADGLGNPYAAGRTVTWSGDVTLYAIWKKN